jgi:hypothetical protein
VGELRFVEVRVDESVRRTQGKTGEFWKDVEMLSRI